MYDPTIGRWLSADPIGFKAGDRNLYRYVGNTSSVLVDASGLLHMRSIGLGAKIAPFTKDAEGFKGFRSFWWGIGIYPDKKDLDALRAVTDPEGGNQVVGVMVNMRKIDLHITIDGRDYPFKQQSWGYSSVTVDETGKLIPVSDHGHAIGVQSMISDNRKEKSTILSDFVISFDPSSSTLLGLTRPNSDREPEAFKKYLELKRKASLCSEGTLRIDLEARLYTKEMTPDGFGNDKDEYSAGQDAFGAWLNNYGRRDALAFEPPPIWNQTPSSSVTGSYTFKWKSDCDGNMEYSFTGSPPVGTGPNRAEHSHASIPGTIIMLPQSAN